MPNRTKPMVVLACMKTHMDGAHCGLGDWYPEIEKGIKKALSRGPKYRWTTGWYSSKKEIASAQIQCSDGKISVEVSVSDDFDTPGVSRQEREFTKNLEEIRDAIYSCWDDAIDNQRDNLIVQGFSIYTKKRKGKKEFILWVETYLTPIGDGHTLDGPPGDNYESWGFQGEGVIPAEIKKKLAKWAEEWIIHQKESLSYKGFTIKPWPN